MIYLQACSSSPSVYYTYIIIVTFAMTSPFLTTIYILQIDFYVIQILLIYFIFFVAHRIFSFQVFELTRKCAMCNQKINLCLSLSSSSFARRFLPLSDNTHNKWSKGAFILKPISISKDKMTLKVQFFGQKKEIAI